MLNELIGNIPRELLRQFPFLFRERNFCFSLDNGTGMEYNKLND